MSGPPEPRVRTVAGNVHEVNMRDKTLIADALYEFDHGELELKRDCYTRPYNVLTRWK